MKKPFYALLLALLVVPILVQNTQAISIPTSGGGLFSDDPGDGFDSSDNCGYIYGTADAYPAVYTAMTIEGIMDFDSVSDDTQGCVDENGYFLSGQDMGFYTNSYYSGTTYRFDFDYSATRYVQIDPATGEWSGQAKITNGSVPLVQSLLDFDWDCASGCTLVDGTTIDPADYHVYTNLTTGEVSGYAWSDYFNDFISFNGLMQELPPQQIQTYVNIFANDGTDTPLMVDVTTAPFADGAESWNISVQFYDTVARRYLDEDDIESLTITPVASSDSNVYINQIENTGDAIDVRPYNTYLGCNDSDLSHMCPMVEDNGTASDTSDDSISWNNFVFSAAPTSNMLGLNEDYDGDIEVYSDRDGCKWIYPDQGTGTMSPASTADCPDGAGSGSVPDKEVVFPDRMTDRNKYELDAVQIDVVFAANREVDLATSTGVFEQVDSDTWMRYYEDGDANLSFRPRYQISQFTADYDGVEHTSISSDPNKSMMLTTVATMSDTSDAFRARTGFAKPPYSVTTQVDVNGASALEDEYLLIDTNGSPSTFESTYITDNKSASIWYNTYEESYAIGYSQKSSYTTMCGTAGYGDCTTATNSISEPRAEQWVCDTATEYTLGDESCYYTEYLPHVDPHKDPESMLVIGAINSVIDADDVLEGTSAYSQTVLSVLGTTETINLRNKMYGQVARYTLGQSAGGGAFESDGSVSGSMVSLMGGRLYYAEGDVTVSGFSGVNKTLVVKGGNVYFDANIDTGHMGVFVLKKNGVGGNVYIDPSVTDLWVNFFLDGSLFSDSGAVDANGVPVWSNEDLRVETLLNQLYLKGSLVSRNTVNGYMDTDGDGYYDLGDGTTTTDPLVAKEYDLNMLRQYRLCHPVVGGVVDTSTEEECADGQLLSDFVIEEDGYKPYSLYNSFILEYEPADQLPIFEVEAGLFN